MIRLTTIAALFGFALITACAPMIEEEIVIVEPVIEYQPDDAPTAKSPIEEACSSGDGIGGTGCPAID